ncbi:uroporphyrinogen-III C-methyltransferase [Colwelliaceae bacterium 6441]
MTDTTPPNDSSNSSKDAAKASTPPESTQEKLAKLSASIDTNKTKEKVTSVKNNESSQEKQAVQMKKASTPPIKNMKSTNTTPLSKTAVFALFIALTSAAGVGGMYYLHHLDNKKQTETIVEQLTALNKASEQRIKQLVTNQQSVIDDRVNQAIADITNTSQTRIEQLEQQLNTLKQNQPSDWLIHEAEYLIRIASRTIWLEHDTSAAINLLADADARIHELNNPQYLPLRQLIREDIEGLKLMPTLKTEDVILTLLAMSKQLPQLSFSMANIPDSQSKSENLELTEDAKDWRSNLAKTWQRFLSDFITVRRRVGDVEPLMSPNHQQNLKENLALKLQQAQWAASEEKSALFTQSLNEIQQWLIQYFDMGHLETAKFYQGIERLKSEVISYDYPSKLLSLDAIRNVLTNKVTADKLKLNSEDIHSESKKDLAPKETLSTDTPPSELPQETDIEQKTEQNIIREDV